MSASDGRIIIGIDPGYGRVGYGVIRQSGASTACVDYGCIETDKALPMQERLYAIHLQLTDLFSSRKPVTIGVEKLFFTKNITTGIEVAQARGVILLTARLLSIPVQEFTPLQVKHVTTGYGKAEKSQVQKMVQLLLNLKIKPHPDDAADALALALCANQLNSY